MLARLVFCATFVLKLAESAPNPNLFFINEDTSIDRNATLETLFFATAKQQNCDVGLNCVELIAKYGYPIEIHRVQTADGYLLDIHRIPHGVNNGNGSARPAVFLLHGLLASSADWINMGPGKGLGYILADRGYDVWMGNVRGNTWSRKHVTLDPDNELDRSAFWGFGYEDIATKDLPAMINHVLNTTHQEKIFYIGHSQATALFWMLMSELPEYNNKIRLMSAFGPIAYMGNVPNVFLQLIAQFVDVFTELTQLIGHDEFMPSSDLLEQIGIRFCNDEAPTQSICSSIIFLICGWNSEQLNKTMLPVMLTNTPAGASSKQVIHLGQVTKSGEFRKYDYGVENILKYGTLTPPKFKLENVLVPVALYYGANDLLDAVVDVERLASELPNVIHDYLIPDPKFNHLDFLWALNAPTVLYEELLRVMAMY